MLPAGLLLPLGRSQVHTYSQYTTTTTSGVAVAHQTTTTHKEGPQMHRCQTPLSSHVPGAGMITSQQNIHNTTLPHSRPTDSQRMQVAQGYWTQLPNLLCRDAAG
jgi:hypothetical protein